jgi:hypothetical protein
MGEKFKINLRCDIAAWTKWKHPVIFSEWMVFGNTTGPENSEFLYGLNT